MQTPIDDINHIELRKAELKNRMDKSEVRMSDLVNKLKEVDQPNTKAEYITNLISKGIAFADSAYFGWKMYNRFSNILHFGKRRKH